MLNEQQELAQNDVSPFIIYHNARKRLKSSRRIRKQSQQLATTAKKHRKLTVDVLSFKEADCQERQNNEEDFIQQLERENKKEVRADDALRIDEVLEVIGNVSEDSVWGSYDEERELENSIPFNCNQWQLDKESPYLKTFSGMEMQLSEIKNPHGNTSE